ncbi:HAD family hydrolase [Aquabacterium soli]|jgi:N-acetyl-D-muramate 6-phosphate phosphatase|uniref:phosphoglycolate phosphatase n=1 Tax=Aquabacterium soli TaxID=2493092 RepID=A0A3R8T2K8_9BURK|nr:HAD-IA family hydrolase [Aquabacterium soli]RRS02554.1 HAD family hydrolase [Aquabacterium soli]
MSASTIHWAQPPQAVLFDLDGTLADTAGDLAGALNTLRLQRGLDPLPVERLRPHASAGARGLIGAGLDIHPGSDEYEPLRLAFLEAYAAGLANTTRLFDGMPELLAALEGRGLRWGVITNKVHRFTIPVMEGLGLTQRAAVIISGDTTAHPKPHPLPLLTACEQLGIPPQAAMYVGDDLRDIQAAQAAGMPSVAAAWGYLGEAVGIEQWGADVISAKPLDLLALL